ncbi:MAG: alpha/beta fold hydrolase [Hyphomicrobiales bacterium]|nr:alpha/beta fold hydrolase [Hyphomicrobiales bacterium]
MEQGSGPRFPALLWPALAAAAASDFASAVAKQFVSLAIDGPHVDQPGEPEWASPNEVVLELAAVRLRAFSGRGPSAPTLICAPFALHGATIADFAPGHSLVAALQRAGVARILVTDWRPATPEMRFRAIDDYLTDLNVLVDEVGGKADLVGLCQGGWMALLYAARFPAKVRRLVLAGAPIDIDAGHSPLSDLARGTPMTIFKEMVDLGGGRILGHDIQDFWAPGAIDREAVHRRLQAADAIDTEAFLQLESRFRTWYAWTVNLPGTYYLEVAEHLFKHNELAAGKLLALGHRVALSQVRCPLFLLAARDDEVVAPEQLFAAEHLVGSPPDTIRKLIAPCDHLGLFMGRNTLHQSWSQIGQWLAAPMDNKPAKVRAGRAATVAGRRTPA